MVRFLTLIAIAGGLFWAYSALDPSARARFGLPQASGGGGGGSAVLTGSPARGVSGGIGNLAGRVFH